MFLYMWMALPNQKVWDKSVKSCKIQNCQELDSISNYDKLFMLSLAVYIIYLISGLFA